jgi:DNA-binding MarR family transcriptional regulator
MSSAENLTELLMMQKALGDVYSRHLTRAARQAGLTRPEADALIFLHNNGDLDTARDIVEYRGFSKAYVSGAVEGLLARGLLTVRVDKADRRYQHLCLTQAALPLARSLRKTQEAFVARLLAGLTPSERVALRAAMGRMNANLMEMRREERV